MVFVLNDSSQGRLYRVRSYTGTVDNPMDLRAFPFDSDTIELHFRTYSSWSSYHERSGSSPATDEKPKTYRLRWASNFNNGKPVFVLNAAVAEWNLLGLSTKLTNNPTKLKGEVTMHVHINRKAAFYFWKALLPIYLLIMLSMTSFHFETDNLEARSSTVSTYFLAAFAMLYVVGSSLPKTDFLTKIDVVIVLTTVSLAFSGMASLLIAHLHSASGPDVATKWNQIMEATSVVVYITANFLIFMPPCFRHTYTKKLRGILRGITQQKRRSILTVARQAKLRISVSRIATMAERCHRQ